MEWERRTEGNRQLKEEIRRNMLDRASYFRSYLTEKTVFFPRAKKLKTLIPEIFYLARFRKQSEVSQNAEFDPHSFIDNIRKSTQEAYLWAMERARSPRDGGVIIHDFIANLDILLHGEEEELPGFFTDPENELFRQWFRQFETEEVYYPVLDEFSVSGRWPVCLLDEIDSWRREQGTKDAIATPAET